MNCQRVEQLLSEQLEGTLAENEVGPMEVHLRECPACRYLQAEFGALRSELRTLARQLPLPDVALDPQTVDAWLAERQAVPGKWPRWLLSPTMTPKLGVAGAATALLLALLALSWYHPAQDNGAQLSRVAENPGATLLVPHPQPDRQKRQGTASSTSQGQRSVPRHGASDPRLFPGPAHRAVEPERPARRVPRVAASQRRQRSTGDLAYLNGDPQAALGQWAPLRPGEWEQAWARVGEVARTGDDFVHIPFPLLAGTGDRAMVAATEAYKREAAIVDARLVREVTCAFKATALSDLCNRLRGDTGIHLAAGRSVADEKVTVFCQKLPLRELMRQLSRPFGYTWLRSGTPPSPKGGESGGYRYELVQDLKSQLLEEELRNRDRHQALLALDQEMSQYRPYFGLTPDEALERAKTAPAAEKKLLERYAGTGWGPAQLYFRLSPDDLVKLRAGERVTYTVGPAPGEQPLPPELVKGALQSFRHARVRRQGDEFQFEGGDNEANGSPPAATPDLRPDVTLELSRGDLGQFTLVGGTGLKISARAGEAGHWLQEGELAVGISPAVRNPENIRANARHARDPRLQQRLALLRYSPASRRPELAAAGAAPSPPTHDRSPNAAPRLTSAEVLEAIHRASGLPIVADYYTRLYPGDQLRVQNQPLFEALNQLCDTMRLRWNLEPRAGGGAWLQFRSASFFNDRLKEVPNRQLSRWATSRQQHGALTLEDLIEIGQLPDAALDAASMAEGAQEIWGLAEWELARRPSLRPHLRFLAALTAAQRQEAQGRTGLAFRKLSLPQQQQYVALALAEDASRLPSLDVLAEAAVRVDYSLPGGFEWRPPVPTFLSRQPPSLEPVSVREQSRAAALQAARRLDPQVSESHIVPTELAMTVQYSLGPESPYRPVGIRASLRGTLNMAGLEPR